MDSCSASMRPCATSPAHAALSLAANECQLGLAEYSLRPATMHRYRDIHLEPVEDLSDFCAKEIFKTIPGPKGILVVYLGPAPQSVSAFKRILRILQAELGLERHSNGPDPQQRHPEKSLKGEGCDIVRGDSNQ
jgi:hypothetical protein